MLSVRGVKASYGDLPVLFGIDLEVGADSIVSLLGPNGAGKTTFLKCLMGLVPATAGELEFDGQAIRGVPAYRIARSGVSLVSEQMNLFTQMTVSENLAMGARMGRGRHSGSDVFDLFPRLYERRSQQAGTMSGGERRMLAIGRALMADPKLLLIDEPSLGLDPKMTSAVFDAISELPARGHAVLLVEQNVHAALSLASHAYVMERGEITMSGPAAELMAQPSIQQAYMGMV